MSGIVLGGLAGRPRPHPYVIPRATPSGHTRSTSWPFELGRSWLLSPIGMGPGVTRSIGIALVVATLGGFGVAAIAALGVAPAGLWPVGVIVGAVASLATLGLFFHPWLVLGLGIDLVLLWAVLVAGWTP